MSIHPTAFVHPSAQLEDGISVGPFALIEAGAKVGRGCVVHAHACILGTAAIGEDCEIGHHAVIGAAPQDLHMDPELVSGVVLGNGNVIREYVTIHRSASPGGRTLVGDRNFIMVGGHLGHDVRMGNDNILANHCLLGGHVEVGDGVFLGGASAFHQFVRIGSRCMVKGLSGISQDIPPYVLATGYNELHGLNVVGMRRAGLAPAARKNVKEAFRKVYLSGLSLQDAIEQCEELDWVPEAREFLDFLRVPTSRGFCRPA